MHSYFRKDDEATWVLVRVDVSDPLKRPQPKQRNMKLVFESILGSRERSSGGALVLALNPRDSRRDP